MTKKYTFEELSNSKLTIFEINDILMTLTEEERQEMLNNILPETLAQLEANRETVNENFRKSLERIKTMLGEDD